MTEFVKAGAPPEILTEAHPHIGTFRLVPMLQSLRDTIEGLGGEYRFQSRVTALLQRDGRITGVRLESGEEICSTHVVLAAGHSARDVFEMLQARGDQLRRLFPSAFASSIPKPDRQSPASAAPRRSWARRIPAGASRQQWARRV